MAFAVHCPTLQPAFQHGGPRSSCRRPGRQPRSANPKRVWMAEGTRGASSEPAVEVLSTDGAVERPPEVEEEFVWNLAIGSNMDEARLRKRGGGDRKSIEPLTPGIPAVAADWFMSMDLLFLPPTEPVMAGAVRKKGESMHGILYKLTKYDYETLAITEGCNLPTSQYKEEVVEAVPYPSAVGEHVSGDVIRAVVFSLRYPVAVPLCDKRLYPSGRYKKMLVEGATAAKLDSAYVSQLADMPAAPPVRPRMKGYTRLCMIGVFCLYKNPFFMLQMRKRFCPAVAWAYSKGEEAGVSGNSAKQKFYGALMILIMFLMVCVGVLKALFDRRNVVKIARGDT